jgi:hypothetical protein
MLIHADEDVSQSSLDDELDQEIFLRSSIYQSEYLLSVRGLGSGLSRDVSGEVSQLNSEFEILVVDSDFFF